MIVPLHAANPGAMTGAGNWTYFLAGAHPVLIDAGVGEAAHLTAIEAAHAGGPQHVVVTHAHGDHISGASAIAMRWSDTRFSKLPWPERDAHHRVQWTPLSDGDRIRAGDGELQVIHTPGHAPDHIALWHAATRTVFSGDLVTPGTTVVIPASMGGSLSEYLQSLQRVLDLRPSRLLPAHGAAIDNPEAVIRKYITHRHEREMQIRAALNAGVNTIDALVERIYIGLAPALVPMARESVLAHLEKLADEGVVHRDEQRWALY